MRSSSFIFFRIFFAFSSSVRMRCANRSPVRVQTGQGAQVQVQVQDTYTYKHRYRYECAGTEVIAGSGNDCIPSSRSFVISSSLARKALSLTTAAAGAATAASLRASFSRLS